MAPYAASVSSIPSISSEYSDTSTIRYCQEPWSHYSNRVDQLCQSLWPPKKKTLGYYLAKHPLLARLRLSRYLGLAPIIKRLGGGDSNRIVGITIPSPSNPSDHHLILRVPRDLTHSQPDREVALLRYISRHSPIPVPTIVGHDFGSNNPLGSPYVLQRRIPGINLDQLWNRLNHAQRCIVAREVGFAVRQLLALESPVTGILVSSEDGETSTKVTPFELKTATGDTVDEPRRAESGLTKHPRAPQTTLDFFDSQINRWREVALDNNGGETNECIALWDKMLQAVQEMDNLGLFKADTMNCLCHLDLQPSNMMAQIQPHKSLKVTAILDWDEAVFAPKFVNCKPPRWLWCDDHEEDVGEEELDPWLYELPSVGELPSTPEKRELKRVFEEHAGLEYVRLAYGEHYRLCRGLFTIAVRGLGSNEAWTAAEKFWREWEGLRGTVEVES